MVAKTVDLPNIRKLFLPDPGYFICDCDLAQADAQVVAWEADDDILKAIFRDPTADLHSMNGEMIYGKTSNKDLAKKYRQLAKAGVHATNYGAKPRTLAGALGISVHEADQFQKKWFAIHPQIHDWHRRVEASLVSTRSVSNAFGNTRHYFDRVETLLPEALAWIPQSTVALVIERAMVAVDTRLFPRVENLMQVHDSLVMQFHHSLFPAILLEIKECLTVTVPYPDPLIIPTEAEISEISWGDIYKVHWDGSRKAA